MERCWNAAGTVLPGGAGFNIPGYPMTQPVVAQAADAAALEEAEAEQLGLFGEPQTAEGLSRAIVAGRRGPGRPVGARNKRTERTVAFLLSRHRDPREVLIEIAEANVFDLAALLGCKPYEAMQEKRLAAIGVLPYVAARITPEVMNDNRQAIYLTINAGSAALSGDGEGVGVALGVVEAVAYHDAAPVAAPVEAEAPSAATNDGSDG